ncbi:DUF7344 domain-containing protein [Halopelagius longus]|nr:hypothetical protein [Halopelagius longus]RDI70375.1 hypothetical protein DWB78_00815 [Halopelagius longus]
MDQESPFQALSDRNRRLTFSCLEEDDCPKSVETLAAEVVAEREDVSPEDVGDEERRTAAVKLYHVHLPKLDEAGLVSFDPEERTVSRATGGVAEQTVQILGESTLS